MCFVSKQRPSQMEGEKGKGESSLAARSEGVEGKKEKRKMMVRQTNSLLRERR